MTTARRLQEIRDQQQVRRRATRLWDAALSGRSALPIPLGLSRVKGGVQQPSIGTTPDLGETIAFHMRGPLVADVSDPYPVILGGSPMLLVASDAAPSGADLDVLRNGSVVDTIALTFTGGLMEYQVSEVYERGDFYALDLTDPGTGGDGLVVATEFRQYVD